MIKLEGIMNSHNQKKKKKKKKKRGSNVAETRTYI